MKIRGANIVITGGASGIGLGLLRRFVAEGAAAVMVADLHEADLASACAETGALPFRCDVSREEDVQALIDSAIARFGHIDLFCANAGIIHRGGVETPNAVWERMWGVNVMAHVFAARHALPHMIERGAGYFLITASAAGLLSQINSASYAVTKHAAVAFAEWLLITHGAQGIGVSALCPQAVASKMTAGGDGGVAGQDGMLTPEEVAQRVVQALDAEQFLILPHPEVAQYFQNKAKDYQRWIRGMQRLQARFGNLENARPRGEGT